MADTPPIDLNSIPNTTVLPHTAIKSGMVDWLALSRLSASQRVLLAAYKQLNFSRQAPFLQAIQLSGNKPGAFTYQEIRRAYDEQMRETGRTPTKGALQNTTESDVA
jgi:hypothetical protein